MKLRIAALALVLSALAASLSAQVRSGTVEISPFYGYLFGGSFPAGSTSQFDNRADVGDNGTYGVGIGYFVNSTLEIEGRWARTETGFVDRRQTDGDFRNDQHRVADLRIDYFLGYATFHFGHGRWVPYATVGMGAAQLDPGVRNDVVCVAAGPPCNDPEPFTRYTAALGGGVKFYANRHIGFRLDGRGYGTYLSSHGSCETPSRGSGRCSSNWLGNFESSGGLIISF
jgi:opacity protein-like surface antigen